MEQCQITWLGYACFQIAWEDHRILLGPKVVIPMHYREEDFGFPVLAPVDDFLTLDGDCVLYPGNTITVTQASRPHVAVLTYQGGMP